MSRTLPISEVKTHLPALVAEVQNQEEEIVVTRKGRPVAVLINFEEYERVRRGPHTPSLLSQRFAGIVNIIPVSVARSEQCSQEFRPPSLSIQTVLRGRCCERRGIHEQPARARRSIDGCHV